MKTELRQELDKIVEISKSSTLCGHYDNDVISISFKIDDDLVITEQSGDENSLSIWCHNEGMSTPTAINLKYADIKSFEYVDSIEQNKRSDGMCSAEGLEIKLIDGSSIIIFEDVA